MKLKVLIVIGIASLICLSPPDVTAQGGGSLTYGALAFGTVTAQASLQLYTFSGTQGDLVEIHLRALSSDLALRGDLLAPDAQTIAATQQDSFAADLRDAQITLRLPQTGAYSLIVSGANNTVGDYALELDGRASVTPTPLVFGQARPVSVPLNAPPQYFSFPSDETCPTTLAVLDPSPGLRYTFPFVVNTRDDQGQQIAALRGGDALADQVTVSPQSGTYEVEVWAADPALSGEITLLVTCAGNRHYAAAATPPP